MKHTLAAIFVTLLALQAGCASLGFHAPIKEDEVREFYEASEFFMEKKYWNAYREMFAEDIRVVGQDGAVVSPDEYFKNMETYFKRAVGHQLEYEIVSIDISDGGEQAIVSEKSETFSVFPMGALVRQIRIYSEGEVTVVRREGGLVVSEIRTFKEVHDIEDK